MSADLIPAATLVLFRSRGTGDPELLMIERGSRMAFAAGAMVFPGGRVDPGDEALAAALMPGAEPSEAAARVAAIRETIEEVGIAVGIVPHPDRATIARLRGGLAAGRAFAGLLEEERLTLEPGALTLFARWQPNLRHSRNFDTCFFIAEAPDDAEAEPDGGESVHATWTTARDALAAADAGRINIIFPTRRNLERLTGFDSIVTARLHAAAFPVRPITPVIIDREDGQWLCIPDDCGYPVTAEPMTSVSRG